MTVPHGTYRLQFRGGMTFERAAALVPYLKRLGISHLYASPIFAATPGSSHGYDVTDHNRLDPDLGGEAGFSKLADALEQAGVGLILDIVPNHMAAHMGNPWWRNVVEWGKASPFAGHFDIDWTERLTLPVLGKPVAEVLANGELGFVVAPEMGVVALAYFDVLIPLAPTSYEILLRRIDGPLAGRVTDLARGATAATSERFHDRMRELAHTNPELQALQQALRQQAKDLQLIKEVLYAQPWRLIYWRDARRHLSYRRFFEVTGLVGVRVEDEQVFDDVHRLILDLVGRGAVDGLRVDHVDGLADPGEYLAQLRGRTGNAVYLVVEKILEANETLPATWPIAGTTGYEFIAALSTLFVDERQSEALDQAYSDCIGEVVDLDNERRRAKSQIVHHNLETELSTLTRVAQELAAGNSATSSYSSDEIREAIADMMIAFPIYRTYGNHSGQSEADRTLIESIARQARERRPAGAAAIELVARLLLYQVPPEDLSSVRAFVTRFQQTTGPVMAKAVEDTLFYRRNRLIALNEVGGEPEPAVTSVEAFHALMQNRVQRQPEGLLATTTHDTKRAEDARARLYAISEAPATWGQALERWRRMNANRLVSLSDGPAPEPEMEWLIYQALAGVWPVEIDSHDGDVMKGLRKRFAAYLEKAMREAKTRSDWTAVNETYEQAVQDYGAGLLSPDNREFLDDFARTLEPFLRAGVVNALAQMTLKLGAPGVPDIYQGTETWDFSLVDPDNRRSVDFTALAAHLDAQSSPTALLADWRSGRIKQVLLSRGLGARATWPALFTRGVYEPLQVTGEKSRHLVAFRRQWGGQQALIVVPRLVLNLLPESGDIAVPAGAWGDTALNLPGDAPSTWTNIFTDEALAVSDRLPASRLLSALPVAMLVASSAQA